MENLEIELVQQPVIKYDVIDEIANQVAIKIQNLDLDNLEVTETTLKEVKKTRSYLNNEFKGFENTRLLIKDKVMKPYQEFETKYKKIATYFKGADEKLKSKINDVEDELLTKKVDGLKEYFNEINKFDFLKFEDLEIKITRSMSDKNLKEEINSAIENVKVEMATIKTLEHSDRILAKYQITKNLNQAIADTNIEIEQEKKIVEAKKEKEEVIEVAEVKEEPIIEEEIKEVMEQPNEEATNEVLSVTFTAKGTLKNLKEFKYKLIELADKEGVQIG